MNRMGLIAALLLPMSLSAQSSAEGRWQTEANKEGSYLHVEISPCGTELCGKIVQAFDKQGRENPDYEHLGRNMIGQMVASGANRWKSGWIWAPDTDKTYKSKMVFEGGKLKVSGCVLGGVFCRSQTWKKVE